MTEKLVKNKFLNEFGHKGQIWNNPEVFKHIWVKWEFFQKELYDGRFHHTWRKLPVAKDWFAMVVSRGTTWSEHSNSKDVGIGSRAHVLGEFFFMYFNTASWVTVSNPHKGVPEKRRSPRLWRGMNNLPVNGITDLSNLTDKKVRKDRWKLISGVDRRQQSWCTFA